MVRKDSVILIRLCILYLCYGISMRAVIGETKNRKDVDAANEENLHRITDEERERHDEFQISSNCGIYTAYYKSGQIEKIYHIFDEKSQGFAISYYENGKTKEYGMVRDGVKVGKWLIFFDNGQLAWDVEFRVDPPGQMIGNLVKWFKNGTKQLECFYSDRVIDEYGIVDGSYREWYSNGKLKAVTQFKEGLLLGSLECWYESGAKAVEACFSLNSPGVPEGLWKLCYESGLIAFKGSFSGGGSLNQYEYFDRNGKSIELKGTEGFLEFIEKFNKNPVGEPRFSPLHKSCFSLK